MRVKLGSYGTYRIDQEEVIKKHHSAHRVSDVDPTKTPIGDDCYEVVTDDCYEVVADDVATLETTNTGDDATINAIRAMFAAEHYFCSTQSD